MVYGTGGVWNMWCIEQVVCGTGGVKQVVCGTGGVVSCGVRSGCFSSLPLWTCERVTLTRVCVGVHKGGRAAEVWCLRPRPCSGGDAHYRRALLRRVLENSRICPPLSVRVHLCAYTN